MYKNLFTPLVVQVEITERCPNRCIHCYNYWRHLNQGQQDSLQFGHINHIMDELDRSKIFVVVITGGEPFLNKKGMYQILDHVESGGFMSARINSSLIGMTDEDIQRLSQYSRLTGILTSLLGPTANVHDSITQHHGSFDETVAGIKALRKHGINVLVNMVVSKLNNKYIMETAALSKKLGIKAFYATRATCPSNCANFSDYSLNLGEFRDYLDCLEKARIEHGLSVGVCNVYPLCAIKESSKYDIWCAGRTCSAGVSSAVISISGDIRACTHIEEANGNIFVDSLPNIWKNMIDWRNGAFIPDDCRSCKALAICGGGCRAESKIRNGSFSDADPLTTRDDVDFAVDEYRKICDGLLREEEYCEVILPDEAEINPNLRWRSEEFGIVCYVGNKCLGIINSDLSKLLLTDISSCKIINVETLADIFPVKLVGKLFQQRILIPYKSEVINSEN